MRRPLAILGCLALLVVGLDLAPLRAATSADEEHPSKDASEPSRVPS